MHKHCVLVHLKMPPWQYKDATLAMCQILFHVLFWSTEVMKITRAFRTLPVKSFLKFQDRQFLPPYTTYMYTERYYCVKDNNVSFSLHKHFRVILVLFQVTHFLPCPEWYFCICYQQMNL